MKVFFCIEDQISRAVAERLIRECCPVGTSTQELGKAYGGYGYIKKNLGKFHQLAQVSPVFIVTDLDRASCPPSLRQNWLQSAGIQEPLPDNMLFCIAQTEIESWLLADATGISNLLKISYTKMNPSIETSVVDAKEYLVQLAKSSKNRSVRNDIAPSSKSAAATGINYNYQLSQFATYEWNFREAANRSVSLHRAVKKLSSLQR